MNIFTTKTPKLQFFFPIRRTTLPQSEIDILNKKARELKTYKNKSQIVIEKKILIK